MNDSGKIGLGLVGVVTGFGLFVIGGVMETASYNNLAPNLILVGLQFAIVGPILSVVSYAGISRLGSGIVRLAAQISGAVLGITLFGFGIGLQGAATTYSFGSEALEVQLAFTGFAFAAIALSAAMARQERGAAVLMPTLSPASTPMQAREPVPRESEFCPFCGEPISASHAFCRKCGRQISK